MRKLAVKLIIIMIMVLTVNIAIAQLEEKIPLAQVPYKIMDAAKKAVFAIDIKEVELVTGKDGSVIYEFEGKKDMKKYEIHVRAEGELIRCGLESEFEPKQKNGNKLANLPEIIRKAVKKAKPGILIHDFLIETEKGQLVYEVMGAVNFEKYEIAVSERGQVLEIEKQ